HFPNSIGLVYNAVTAALGFDPDGDWHKTMWLAPTGKPEFSDVFNDLVGVDEDGLPAVNLEYFDYSFKARPQLSDRFFQRVGLSARAKDESITDKHRHLAASLQSRIEDVLVEIASRRRQPTGLQNLCLAGGVALNSLANAAVERRSGFKR